MPAGIYNFKAEQGATLEQTILYAARTTVGEVVTETPIDLTGYTAAMQVRLTAASVTVILELTTENGRLTLGGAAGTVDVLVSAVDMTLLTPGKYFYDLELYTGTTVIRMIEGNFPVKAEVTRI